MYILIILMSIPPLLWVWVRFSESPRIKAWLDRGSPAVKRAVAKEIQDEIEQNFAWWDRQFAALSKEAFPGQARLPEHYLYPKTTPNEYLEKFGIDPRNVPADERYCTPEGYYMFVRDLQGRHVIENGQTKKRFQPWPAGFDYWGAWRNAVNSHPGALLDLSQFLATQKVREEEHYAWNGQMVGGDYVLEVMPHARKQTVKTDGRPSWVVTPPKGQHVYAMPTVGPKGTAGDSGASRD